MKRELNVIRPRAVGGWILAEDRWIRAMEAGVLCNYEGHGGVEKVGDLIAALQKFPQNGIFTIDEDEASGRMGIFVNWNEMKPATEAELRDAAAKIAEQRAADRRLEAERERAAGILRKANRRQEIQGQLVAVRAAMDGVREELKNPHASEEEDLCADLETLETEEARLEAELANL